MTADLGTRAMTMIADLARHTDEPGRLTRLYLSPAHKSCADATADLMRAARLAVSPALRPAPLRSANCRGSDWSCCRVS